MPTEDFLGAKTSAAAGLLQASNARRVLVLLFAANLLNFYDRAIPAIVVEPLKAEFSLSDLDIGLLSAAFTVVYALVGLPLGRLADRFSRKKIMGTGLVVWSLLTAATGFVGSYAALFLVRLGVGVGEAAYAPAANSTISDLFPAHKRARAFGVFQLGLPIGLILAFFTVGSITEAFGTWRAAFLIAAVPGLLLAVGLFLYREPLRGASETAAVAVRQVGRPFRTILRIRTFWWLTVAAIGSNIAAYSVNTFCVPLLQRYFGLSLTSAALMTGVVVGVTGLVGLLVGGALGDRLGRRSPRARVLLGAVSLLVATPLSYIALQQGPQAVGVFVAVFGLAWLLQYLFYTAAYPALADVVEPRLRSTATALFFAAFYLLGGAVGPVIAGALSDSFAASAEAQTAAQAAAIGLRSSLGLLVPLALLLGAIGLFGASRTVNRDSAAMQSA